MRRRFPKLHAFFQRMISWYQQSAIGMGLTRFGQNQSSAYAAGLAFYAFFSLFPLLLTLVSIGSFILERYYSQDEILDTMIRAIPLYRDWMRINLENAMRQRGTIGVVSLVTLLWAASSYFNMLIRAINNAWPGARHKSFLWQRSTAIGMVVGIILLLLLTFVSSTVLNFLSHFQVPMGGDLQIYETFLWEFFSNYFIYIFSLIIFWILYFFTPNVKVKKRAAFIGALPASIAWNLLNDGFTWFLRSGLARYELIYGSLSSIVSFLFWIYLSNVIILLGAYITAGAQSHFFSGERKSLPQGDPTPDSNPG